MLCVLQERRLAAVRELVRLLKPGGQALIYVWAFEQEYNKQRSKYLKEEKKEQPEKLGPAASTSEDIDKPRTHTNEQLENHRRPVDSVQNITEGKLSMHTNRTAFNTQDLLVPWHLKEGKRRGDDEPGESGKRKEKSKKSSGSPCSLSSASFKTKLDCNHESSPGLDSRETDPGAGDVTTNMSSSTVKSESGSGPAPVFHRYYHVFQQGELEQMCGQVAGVKVQRSYHDQGNWCVILEKD